MIELKPHNKKAVEEIKNCILDGAKKIIYVAGTGCGKTWVFMGVAYLLKGMFSSLQSLKVLYVMPKHIIKENVEGYGDYKDLPFSIDFVTFNYFTSVEKGLKKIKDYDLVVIDECHHLGSEIYGLSLKDCMDKADKYFLGLTATPVRDTDNFDVSSYFEKRVNGISVWDAIRMELMPTFYYHICLPDKDTRQLEKEYGYSVRAVVDCLNSQDTVSDIISVYRRKKWICFFATERDLNKTKPSIEEIFKGYTIVTLLSSLNNLKEVMEIVKNAENVVVLSVNILLEGVHLDDISGIILYRNVSSTIAFQQIIGRTCKIGNTINPVIIDTSQSARHIMAKLIREDGHFNGAPISQNGVSDKPIMHVGIGSTIEYDINKVLKFCDLSFAKEEEIRDASQKGIEKYYGFGGSFYKTYEELKANKLDFNKFRACAEICGLTPQTMFKHLEAS